MTWSQTNRVRMLALGAALLPLAGAVGVRWVAPATAPRAASGRSVGAAVTPETPRPVRAPATEAERAAAERAGELLEVASLASPFVRAAAPTAEDPRPQTPSGGGQSRSLPRIRLTSILTTRDGPVATIDGQVRRSGDRIDGDWVLDEIDPRERRVILRHRDGLRVAVPMP